ncbi:MAG: hypothetical protein H6648_10645 [Caldilineae bacterium]|nr:hypothetical protein [Chloroflexota bacterium]MCB9177603.1 hypothetical protein [Caldilineae bacterium]
MMVTRWTRILAIGVVALGLVGCKGAAPASDATSGDGAVEQDATAPGETSDATTGDPSGAASTSEEASPADAAPAKRSLVEQGQRRTVRFEEAVDGLPFTPLEPSALPKGAARSVVHLIQPIEGIENPALPAVRFIYDFQAGGTLILVQSIARGDLGEGDDVEVSGVPAKQSRDGDSEVLVFERDGINVELRGKGLPRAQVLALAESLLPYSEIGAGGAGASDAAAPADDTTDADAADSATSDGDAAGDGSEGGDGSDSGSDG